MSIKTDESLADADFSRSLFPIPSYVFLLGMSIRRDQLISPRDYLPGREWVNGSAVAHLLRAPVRTRSFPPAGSLPFDTRVQTLRNPLSNGFSRVDSSPLDILSRSRSRSLASRRPRSHRCFIVSFPRGLSTRRRCSCSILVSFTTEEVTRPLGCAQTPETPHTYRTNESFIIGRALKKFLRARGGSGERSD